MHSTPKNNKRPREADSTSPSRTDVGVKSQPKNKKNSPSVLTTSIVTVEEGGETTGTEDTADQSRESTSESSETSVMPSVGQDEAGNTLEASQHQKEVNNSKDAPPALTPDHWEQIMARFDTFEKSIQSTIKEEIKVNTSGLQNQVKKLNTKFKEVEIRMTTHKTEMDNINIKVAKLDNLQGVIAAAVEEQVSAQMSQLREEIKNSKEEIKELKESKAQVSQLREEIKNSKEEIKELKENKSDQGTKELRQEFLREKCYTRKRNLMLMGLEEPKDGEDEQTKVATLLKNRLGIPLPKIDMVYRIGDTTGKNPRPVLITFPNLTHRFAVWNKKGKLNKDQEQKLWLQEDYPKPLREEFNALIKIQRRAKALGDKYPNVRIKGFKIRINGRYYGVEDICHLPDDLRFPPTSTLQSDTTVAFFGRSSPLSNHHICEFTIAGRKFTCVEHFLAWQRANTAEQRALADSVLIMKDPTEHKKVLNSLRESNAEKWEETVENVLLVALRAKFTQNLTLGTFLCETYPRRIGEASINQTWGIGLTLKDENVLNQDKWCQEGNRLGKALEAVRRELHKD